MTPAIPMDPSTPAVSAFDLIGMLAPTHAVAQEMVAHTRGIFRGLVLVCVAFSTVRSMLLAQQADPYRSVAQTLLCWGALENFEFLFTTVVNLGDSLAGYFMNEAGYADFFRRYAKSVVAMASSDDSLWDKFRGFVKGARLAGFTAGFYWFGWAACWIMAVISAVVLSFLYVTGPLWVAGGVIGDGGVLRKYAGYIVRVLLWNVFPCFALMAIQRLGSNSEAAAANLSLSLATCSALGLSALLSPLIINMFVGHGVGPAGSLAFHFAVGAAAKGLGMAAQTIGLVGRGASAGAGASRSAAASGGGAGTIQALAPPPVAANLEGRCGLYQPRALPAPANVGT